MNDSMETPTTTASERAKIAEMLWQARITGVPCDAPTEILPNLSLQCAYSISESNLRRRVGQAGIRLVGKKIGLTSRAVQKQLSVHEPDFGFLTSDMNLPQGESLDISLLHAPRVEGEVAFVLKRDLVGPGLTAADVLRAVDFYLPCIEIIDSRVRDWKIKIQDTVADNASSSHFVLGTKPVLPHRIDLASKGMVLKVQGEEKSTGVGRACLDHPVNAVVWLANRMGALGMPLHAGEVILSGAFGPVVPIRAGDFCEVEIADMGKVFCSFHKENKQNRGAKA